MGAYIKSLLDIKVVLFFENWDIWCMLRQHQNVDNCFYEDIEMLKGLLYTVEIGKNNYYS